MEKLLAHLPETKQEQILWIVEVIKEISPAKIVLYGSHASGKWQQDYYMKNNIRYEFNSDYDFLVAMKDNDLKTIELADKIENKCRSKSPINALVLSIDHINEGLERGQYFFVEIINNGILLFDTGEVEFAKPRQLTIAEKRAAAQEHFDYWFDFSSDFFETAVNAFNKAIKNGKRLNFATYNLFQAVEGFYSTILLVFTDYKPKTHNLDKFKKYSRGLSKEFDEIFPSNPKDRYDAELFDVLKRAYIGAKYNMGFLITPKEFGDLSKKVEKMRDITEHICKEKITSFR